MSENTTDLDHIISKLSGEGGLGQLLLNDDVKAKLVEYLHKETNLSKVVIKFTLGIIYKLANNCIKQTNKQINSYFQNKISKYSALIKALNWYFDELEKKLNAKNFFKDIKDGKLNADNLDKLDTSLQAVGTIYRQNEEIKGLIAEALSQLSEIIDTLETMKVKLPINLAPTTHSDTKLQRFHYNSAFIPFVGREKEQEILKKFVDSEPPFSWLSLCEQGGAGKSRLAYHFCHHGVDAFWDKGFFKVNPNTNTDDFNQWQPSLDTFIVIDYAGNHIQKVKTLLSNFEQKAQVTHCKIRVLLLERNLKTPNNWYEVLTSGSGNSLKTFEYSDPFNLNALSDEENYNIAEQFAPSKLPSSQDFSAKLEKIDTKKRAFFAAMLADSIEQGTSSNNKEALFDEYYRRSYEHFWKKIDNKYYYFLGLASIGANINPKMLNGYPQVELFPIINEINQQHIKALEINYNNGSYTNTAVDLMAEYFVLKHILSDDYTIIQTSNGNTWLNYIWQDLPEYAVSFTARCLFDFPELAKSLLNLTESDNLTTVANILVYLTAITGDTNLEQTTTHYRTLRDLASKHKQSEIYIAQAKALFNLITYYGETNLEQATKHYQTLDNLASKHKQSEIYIEQAKALVNLVNYYGETNLEQAKTLPNTRQLSK
ncbi:MAG: hypothetical protein Ctma_1226 [Catillopecten margaritatus gill symbiont]|uniref:NB-ARC domain-containing protein n=1 Tax=Catillopecten margaritatus gill symbiont TaxID=3083288 RepID=A0AAU6PHP1_9GAMM